MKIKVVPKRLIENISESEEKSPFGNKWGLISIYADMGINFFTVEKKLKKKGCVDFMEVKFHDITWDQYKKIKEEEPGTHYSLFDDIKARLIINFIDDIKNKVDTLVTQCAAGISRSGAVGLFACRYLNLDENLFREHNKHILPNQYVLEILNKESGIHDDYVKYWQQREEDMIIKVDKDKIF